MPPSAQIPAKATEPESNGGAAAAGASDSQREHAPAKAKGKPGIDFDAAGDRIEYRAPRSACIAELGEVVLSNWIGRIGNRHVRVYRGAVVAKIPPRVLEAIAASDVGTGYVTHAELGIKAPQGGPVRGATVRTVQLHE
jgi:hypothetical protein